MIVPKFFFCDEFIAFEPLLRACGAREIKLNKGTYILDLEEQCHDVYYIKAGCIRYSLLDEQQRENHLMYFGPGQLFPISMPNAGSMIDTALIAKVIEDGEGLIFSADMMEKMLCKNPAFMRSVMQHLLDEIKLLLTRQLMSSNPSPEYKFCNFLYLFDRCYKREQQEMAFTQTELAAAVGLSRVQVSRVIGKLREEGVIRTMRHRIVVADHEKLLHRCSYIVQEGGA